MFVDLNRYLLQREKFYSSMEKLLHSKDIPVEDRASIIERLATHPRLDALKDYLENELLSQVEDELKQGTRNI